jgi:hypothetical protein
LENFLQAKAMAVENFYSFERYIGYETLDKFFLATALVPFYIMYCTWLGMRHGPLAGQFVETPGQSDEHAPELSFGA